MYFNETKGDTNIDKELKKNKKIDINKYKKPIIIIGSILLILIVILIIIAIIRRGPRYYITLNGSENITIYQGTTYNEPGYNAFDNKRNNLNEDVKIASNLDSNTIGTYTITYTLYNKTKTRTIKVIEKPAIVTVIHLNGEKNIYLNVGSTYNEPGYSAIDNIDGDLTSKVTVNSNVDTSKKGTYRIIYSVVNSTGVTTSETRTIVVE